MKIVKKIPILLLLVFVGMQFVRPDKNLDTSAHLDFFETETIPSESVLGILKTACYDCHSNHTNYPWYAEVAPVSYWLNDHIEHGQGHLNFSEWEAYSVKRKDHKLEELIEMVKEKEMPLDSYTWVHGDAVLSEAQIKELTDWAENLRLIYQLDEKPQ